jgi:drug/metabolite transporter (DMT)-like permease
LRSTSSWRILYGGIFSVGLGYTLQVAGQRKAPPAHAAILLSLEAVFAAIGGFLLLGERLGGRALVGCALMLVGMIASETGLRTRAKGASKGARVGE